ncbi:MAG: helix-turn-helix transcriptional regulator [Granulosicoccus sp.]|nr:helix-turn-helix transcriptional regulator [Granulosicoccus sp.]
MTTNNSIDKIDHCPALITISAISGKWKTRILWLLRTEELGFNDLRRRLRRVSAKVLTDQLRELEADGILYLNPVSKQGVQYSRYGFTHYGKTLIPILNELGSWGLRHEERNDTNGP